MIKGTVVTVDTCDEHYLRIFVCFSFQGIESYELYWVSNPIDLELVLSYTSLILKLYYFSSSYLIVFPKKF